MGIGVLKNGLGSLRNLYGLLASIRVGPRELSGAVAALGEDCDSLHEALQAVEKQLLQQGVEPSCVLGVIGLAQRSVCQLAEARNSLVKGGRFSVAQRLRLEPEVGRAVAALEATVPLMENLCLACPARASAPALAEMVHEASQWGAGASLGRPQPVSLELSARAEERDLKVDLRTARSLVSLGVSLVAAHSDESARRDRLIRMIVSQAQGPGQPEASICTTIVPGEMGDRGRRIEWMAYHCCEATLECSLELSRISRVHFSYNATVPRVEIRWPSVSSPN